MTIAGVLRMSWRARSRFGPDRFPAEISCSRRATISARQLAVSSPDSSDCDEIFSLAKVPSPIPQTGGNLGECKGQPLDDALGFLRADAGQAVESLEVAVLILIRPRSIEPLPSHILRPPSWLAPPRRRAGRGCACRQPTVAPGSLQTAPHPGRSHRRPAARAAQDRHGRDSYTSGLGTAPLT